MGKEFVNSKLQDVQGHVSDQLERSSPPCGRTRDSPQSWQRPIDQFIKQGEGGRGDREEGIIWQFCATGVLSCPILKGKAIYIL